MKKFFDVPTQVLFYDVDGDHYVGGIAYHDEVICGCCGGIMSIDEIYEFAPSDIEMPIRPLEWIDISSEIRGCIEM